MNEKLFALALSAMLLAISLPAKAQQPNKVFHLGYLSPRAGMEPREQAFQQRLRALGYVEGNNIIIEWRFANAKPELLHKFTAELVGLKVDLILVSTTPAILAVKKATETMPIVMIAAVDPVEAGLVASLARPGGNITGLTSISAELYGKRLELLKEVIPRLSRVGVLKDPGFTSRSPRSFKEVESTANRLGLTLQSLDVHSIEDIEPAFRNAMQARSQALVHFNHTIIVTQIKRVADLAAKNRLPMIYNDGQFMETGGLMSYGTNGVELYRRAAVYVDKILKGTKPADLPVEQPTKFELVINLKSAKQIGLTIPPNVLARADRVIR